MSGIVGRPRKVATKGSQLPKTGLVLSGGGARGAYQIGVLRGILEVATKLGLSKPFQILTGVSAGAVNTAYLAAYAGDVSAAVDRLTAFWGALRSEDVFRTDPWSLSQTGFHWALDAVSDMTRLERRTRALLDTSPLAALLQRHIPFDAIRANLQAKFIDAVAVSATDYASTECMSFYMARRNIKPWRRSRRVGLRQDIGIAHVMASAAIPLIFPPVPIGNRYFGDGCLRNIAPLSPAVHLGAERLMIIGVRKAAGATLVSEVDAGQPADAALHPSIARVLNVIINAVLLDAVDADIERLSRINRTVTLLPDSAKDETTLRPIDWLYFHPSVDIATIALEQAASMPRLIRYLVTGLGTLTDAADMVSYLLFEPAYCQRLLDLGYRDALTRAKDVELFLGDRRQRIGASPSRGAGKLRQAPQRSG